MFDDEQFIVDGLRTVISSVLRRVKDLVRQLQDWTAHEVYYRVRQKYGALDEQPEHAKATLGRLANNFCEVKRRLKKIEGFCAHRVDAT